MEREIPVHTFGRGSEYDRYLLERNVVKFKQTAVGITYKDGSQEIVIWPDFYLNAGIKPEFLDAVIAHEVAELSDDKPNKHFFACFSEYQMVLERHGAEALQEYHTALTSLMDPDPDRDQAFAQVLKRVKK